MPVFQHGLGALSWLPGPSEGLSLLQAPVMSLQPLAVWDIPSSPALLLPGKMWHRGDWSQLTGPPALRHRAWKPSVLNTQACSSSFRFTEAFQLYF